MRRNGYALADGFLRDRWPVRMLAAEMGMLAIAAGSCGHICLRVPAFCLTYVYVDLWFQERLPPAVEARRNRYVPVRMTPVSVRRSRYAFRKPRRPEQLAELGTPQKQVRGSRGDDRAGLTQKRVRNRREPGSSTMNVLQESRIWSFRTGGALIAAQKRVRQMSDPLWISLCNAEVIPAENGSALALKRVRVYADSGSRLRRIEYAAAQNQVRRGTVYVYGSTAWPRVYGLRVVNRKGMYCL